MQITILGSFRVHRDGTDLELGGPKQRAVLAALVVERGETVSIGRLLDVVWGDEPPEQAEASLQSYVSKLRKELEPDRAPRAGSTVLVTRPGGYALELPPEAVDAERFTDLVRRARAAHLRADRGAALAAYDAARSMWAPPLPEFESDRFVLATRLRLDELHAAAAEERVDVLLESGAHRELVGELEAAVEEYPLREHRWYQLALARYRAGQQTDALRAVARARAVLAEEAGLDAGHELVRLEADLLAQSASLDAPLPAGAGAGDGDGTAGGGTGGGAAPPVPRPPHSAATGGTPFFGRRDELSTMLDSLDAAVGGAGRIVVVSGEPGIGKTRLAEEVARVAADRGVVVGWARCPESAATETLRPILQLGQVLMDEGVTPWVDLDDAVEQRSEADRSSALVDAFVGAVRRLDRAPRPFMAVIDDLQWADPSSLRVIEHGAADLANVPILLVVTVRPPDPGAPAALVDCLGEL
ncbi:MAG: AAA family ATPase, partial [Microthrixaceae bacterium]